MERSNNSTNTVQDEENQSQRKTKVFMTKEKIEIMKNMIRQGCSTKAISANLNISEFSARSYKRKIEEGQEALIMPKSNMNYLRQEISENIVTIVFENNAVTLHGIQ